MEHREEHISQATSPFYKDEKGDYSYVSSTSRIAVYDDMRMPPRVLEIQPAPTAEYIEKLADVIDEQKRRLGGSIPYTAIREVAENFIHAHFNEVVVSILDNGNTIRFCDQGPGISDKEKAVLPGFTSANEQMKQYIRGVGSGLPLVREYLNLSSGTITIEDNIDNGAVVTISLKEHEQARKPTIPLSSYQRTVPLPALSDKEQQVLFLLENEGALGVTDIVNITGWPNSSVYVLLRKLKEAGLVEVSLGKKRILTDYGEEICQRLHV